MTSKTSKRKGRRKNKTRNIYYQAIDQAIVDVLSQVERMSNGELKREVEQRCESTIPSKTWSNHLKKMQLENYLLKDDTLQRNQKVFYSLTEFAKELRDLKLLRTDPKRVTFIQIYANLLFRIIIEGTAYPGDDLENILNEIHANKQELYIDDIKKKFIESHVEKRELTTVPEIPLRVITTTYYKPTSLGVKIIESTSYRENIFYKNRIEYTSYTYTVPGASVEDLAQLYYTFKPCMADCETAIELLLRRDIISPIMDFRGKTRYVIADPALTEFVTEFNRFFELEKEHLNVRWQHLSGPTSNEEQSISLYYSDKTESAKFFTRHELQRYLFKQAGKNNEEILKLQTKLEELQTKFEKNRLEYFNYLNEKYRGIINKKHFLREIIQIISPSLHFIHSNSQTK
jgi:hypothetical protein